MKRLLLAMVLSFGLVFFLAPYVKAETSTTCTDWAELAAIIMINRQIGVPVEDSFEAAGGSEAIEMLVLLAYSAPRFNTEEEQQEMVDTFRTRVFLECIKAQRRTMGVTF